MLSQTKASDLYGLKPGDNYPEYMPKIKEWIDEAFTGVNLADIQFSESRNRDNDYHSFRFISRTPIFIKLPQTDGFKMIFAPKIEGKRGTKTQTYRMNHQISIHAYNLKPGINLNYSIKEYYEYANSILRLNDTELIANTLNFMVKYNDKKNKVKTFVDDVNKKEKLNLPYPTNENVKDLAALIQKTKKKCSDIIFETYIDDKKEEIAEKKLNTFFTVAIKDGTVIENIDELRTHKINVGMDDEENIEIPLEFMTPFKKDNKDSLVKFQYKNIETRLDFKNKKLEIHFLGHLNQLAFFSKNIKKRSSKKGKEKWIPIENQDKGLDISKLTIIVTEKKVRIEAEGNWEEYEILDNKL
jgi:hypothetical protein